MSSVEVALLIDISICGICSPMLACLLSLFPPPPFPTQYVCVWPDAAWQVLRPTSIFHTLTAHINRHTHIYTHTNTQNCTDTHTTTYQKCLCMACAGVEGGNGRERNKNNFSSLFLPVWFYMQRRLWQMLHCHESWIHFLSDTDSKINEQNQCHRQRREWNNWLW